MQKIATYIILFAALWSAACTHTEELYSPQNSGDELVVRTELVSASDWVTTRSEGPAIDSTEYETPDGEYLIVATKQEWTGIADTLAANTPVTRGTPIVSATGIANMRVNIFSTGTTAWSTSSALTKAITATNVNGSFTTYPGYSWVIDADAKTSLFAYSPIPTGSNGLSEVSLNKITYTVPTSVAQQPDLCTAAPHMNVVNNDGVQQVRTFALRHQLAAVGFAMLGWNLKITKITVSGVVVTGTLTMNTNGTTGWVYSNTGSRDVGVTGNSYKHTANDNYANITTSNGYLMMMPQTLPDAATVTITYATTDTGSSSGTITAKLKDIIPTWIAGDKITYNIRLKTAPALTSGNLTIVTGAAGYTTSSPMTFLTDSQDNLTFTWSGADWLRIYRGSPKTGDVSGGQLSGWSTSKGGAGSNIYFFAYSSNPSASADRTAQVTVSGTRSGSKTFTVTQKKLPQLTLDKTAPGEIIPALGKSYSVRVTATTPWKISASLDCRVLPSSGTGTQNVTITVPQNTNAGNVRTVSVTFSTTDGAVSSMWTGNQAEGPLIVEGFEVEKVTSDDPKGDWSTANAFCTNKGNGWRLPVISEVEGIIRAKDQIPSKYSLDKSVYWTRSKVRDNSYWALTYPAGGWLQTDVTVYRSYRCVRTL